MIAQPLSARALRVMDTRLLLQPYKAMDKAMDARRVGQSHGSWTKPWTSDYQYRIMDTESWTPGNSGEAWTPRPYLQCCGQPFKAPASSRTSIESGGNSTGVLPLPAGVQFPIRFSKNFRACGHPSISRWPSLETTRKNGLTARLAFATGVHRPTRIEISPK
jgi:hypothetical protein